MILALLIDFVFGKIHDSYSSQNLIINKEFIVGLLTIAGKNHMGCVRHDFGDP